MSQPASQRPANAPADLVLRGGAVYQVDAARSWAQAVAVRDGLIAAVGTDARSSALTGPGTEVVELGGRMLLPGFIDAHVHASGAGLERMQCDLAEAHGLDDYLDLIRRYAQARPDAAWITGGGWSMDVFPGGTAVPARPGPGGARPAGVPVQPGPPRGLGQHQGPGAGRDHRQHARPGRRPRRARGRRQPGRHPAGGRHGPGPAGRAPARGGRPGGRHRRGPALPARAGHHRLAGGHRRRLRRRAGLLRRLPGGRPPRAAHRAGGRRAVVAARPRARAAARPHRAPRAGRPAGPVPGHQHQDHAGRRVRELHRLDADPVPGRARPRDRRRRPQLLRRGRAPGVRHRHRRGRVPGPLPRHRRPGRARGPRRRRGGQGGQRRGPGAATTSRTSRSSTPRTCPGSATWTWPPTARRCGPARNRR